MTSDQFWSFFAMPIGLMICFTPIVVAWLSASAAESDKKSSKNRQ
jgi:hypothetical protein